MKNIILASSSPRRIEMMKNNGYNPAVIPADIDEKLPMNMRPVSAVMYISLKKAHTVCKRIFEGEDVFLQNKDITIIAADTSVVYNNIIIGKPTDRNEAFNILNMLRNNSHKVITGVSIINAIKRSAVSRITMQCCFYESTDVYFGDYTERELIDYINTTEPYDKAGGYAIQGSFGKYIKKIDGDFDNVVGFPWYRIKDYLL